MAHAQDQAAQLQRKNTIKLDITSQWLYRNAIIASYERITKPNQSFSITGGYQQFPASSSLGSRISVKDDKKKTGLSLAQNIAFT